MSERFDVAIVGGGPVGASLACALAPSGLRIAVVEARTPTTREPAYDERTLALALGSQRILEAIGIWGAIDTRAVCPIETIHISDRGHPGIARLRGRDVGVPALGYVVEVRALTAALYAAMAAHRGIALLAPAELDEFGSDEDGGLVTLRMPEGRRTLSARLVVAADGAQSSLRKIAGIGVREVDYAQTAIVTTVTPTLPHRHTAFERFTDSGPLALLPMQGDRCAAVWSVRPDDVAPLLALDDDTFRMRLQEQFGQRLGALVRIGARLAFPLKLTQADVPTATRLVVIGNAAHTLHPVAGQGFNLGLRDVATLAQTVTDTARAGGDIGGDGALREYASWRERDTRATVAFTSGMVRIFSNDFFPLVGARSLGLLAVDLLPPIKRALLRRTMGLNGRLPRLARGLPL